MVVYLWKPIDIRQLSIRQEVVYVGDLRDLQWQDVLSEMAKSPWTNPKVIITVEFKPNTTNKITMTSGQLTQHVEMEAIDQCYPLYEEEEWDKFKNDDINGTYRNPIEVYIADGNKYTAPI